MELLILYACVQFYTPQASDYRLISKTGIGKQVSTSYVSDFGNLSIVDFIFLYCKKIFNEMIYIHYTPQQLQGEIVNQVCNSSQVEVAIYSKSF